MIRCGRLSVEGEEEIALSPGISKPRQRHGKPSNNPYSSRGLDKFTRLSDELSAKREYVASKTGTPEEFVRFVHSSRGWVPVVFKNSSHGGTGEDLILPPIRLKEHKESKNRTDCNRGDGNYIGEDDDHHHDDVKCEVNENGSAKEEENVPVTMLPWWSGYLKTAAFGVLSLSTILARKSALRAAAMAGVMVVGYLQIAWQGFVTWVSFFFKLLLHWKGEKMPAKAIVQASPENKLSGEHGSQDDSLLILTAPSSPTLFCKGSRSQELNTQLENEKTYNEKKKFERIVSMDGQAAKKPIRLQKAGSFLKRRKAGSGTYEATAIATVMIIVLFCLIFYGRLPAICFTSAWWYVLPKFRMNRFNTPVNGRVIMDLQSREYRKKIYH